MTDGEYSWMSVLPYYLRKYYSPDVEIERVAEYDGYSIWNFYIPDGVEDLSVEQ